MEAFRYVMIINLKYLIMNRKRNGTFIAVSFLLFFGISLFANKQSIEQPFSRPLQIGVLDLDNTLHSQMLIDTYKNNKSFFSFATFEVIDQDKADHFISNGLDGIIIIPKLFSYSLMFFEHIPIEVELQFKDPLTTGVFIEIMKGYSQYIKAVEINLSAFYDHMIDQDYDEKLRTDINNLLSYKLIFAALERETYINRIEYEDFKPIRMVEYFTLSVIIGAGFILAIIFGNDIHHDIHSSFYKRVFITRLKPLTYWFAKVCAFTIYQSGYVVLLLGCLSLWTHSMSFFSIENLLIIILLLGSFFMIISGIAFWIKDVISYNLIQMMMVMIILLLGGNIIPIHLLHPQLRLWLFWLPNYQIFDYIINTKPTQLINNHSITWWITFVLSLSFLYASSSYFQWKEVK